MRKLLFTLFIFFSINAFSQQVTVSGIAFDTTNGRNWVRVVLNDTLRKVRESKNFDRDQYLKLTTDTTIAVYAKGNGRFLIAANETDSLFFTSFNHKPRAYRVADLLRMKSVDIRLEPEVCIPYVRCNEHSPSKVYAFIGSKIAIADAPYPNYCNFIAMDSRYKATYKIIENTVGNYANDTISFTVYDHYGFPSFGKYENVLLFVSEYCGELIHEKYLFFDVYRTADGRWASPGAAYKYIRNQVKNQKAVKIKFADSVWFDISKLSKEAAKLQYPKPYYKIEGNKAIPVMGSYVNELIDVRREGEMKTLNGKPLNRIHRNKEVL